MLAPELQGRDLRISSQTGSGKTVAIGLTLRDELRALAAEATAEPSPPVRYGGDDRDTKAHPRAIVVTPTRELAKQVHEELAWLYAPLGARVASVTGGGGYRDELRSFRANPPIIVGTPGRLLDHLKRGAIDASLTGTIVLDEADRMLDLGFRDDLEAILGFAPEEHRTHLVSATFPREVKALADRVQSDPVHVQGTPLGTANRDIEHLVHLVEPRERFAAIVNLLLEQPNRGPSEDGGASPEPASRGKAPTLIFARTRADVAELAGMLSDEGFTMAMLSGEMDQAERNRALAAFKRGHVDALVATDVAARGIDVQDVARVIHAESPDDADAYTHRSGRTGRAGKKGISSLLATRSELPRVQSLLQRARVEYRFAPIPTAEAIRESRDAALLAELTADFVQGTAVDPRSLALAERIVGSSEPVRAVARLVAIAQKEGQAEPREVTPVAPPAPKPAGAARRSLVAGPGADTHDGGWVTFRVSWGQAHGASAPRLVAMMCRRGRIEGRDLGAIRVGRTSSVVEVSEAVAADFERAASRPDPRDPRIFIRRWSDEPPARVERDGGRGDRRPPPRERREAIDHDSPREPEIPKERPSRAAPKGRPSVPKDRPSRATPKDRPSVAKAEAPKDRPSVPKDRPSVPKDRSSRAIAKDRPSVPRDRPSVAKADIPSERPSRGAPKDKPSVPRDRPSRGAAKGAHAPKTHPPRPHSPKPHHPKHREHGAKADGHARPYATPDQPRAAKSDAPRGEKKPWKGPRPPGKKTGGGPPWRGGNARPKRRP